MPNHVFTNFPKSTISGALSEDATKLNVSPGTGLRFPVLVNGNYFGLVAIKANGQKEVMRVIARSGDELTVTRAREGSSALAFSDGAFVQLCALAELMGDMSEDADAQKNLPRWAVTSGIDTKVATVSPAPASYADGYSTLFIGGGRNTGPLTINLNGLGAVAVKKFTDGVLAELEADDYHDGAQLITYKDPDFILDAPALRSASELNHGTADTEIPKGSDVKDFARTFTKQQVPANGTIESEDGVLNWDLEVNQVAFVTLEENVTTFDIQNPRPGGNYSILFTQDNPGGWTVAWPSSVLWPFGGTPPTISPGVAAIDLVTLHYFSPDFLAIWMGDFA